MGEVEIYMGQGRRKLTGPHPTGEKVKRGQSLPSMAALAFLLERRWGAGRGEISGPSGRKGTEKLADSR